MGFYIHDRPVVGPSYYYGREILVRSLHDGLLQHRAFALCGGPKTGRTSTLLQVEMKLRERLTRKPGATRLVPIYFDLAGGPLGAQALAKRLWGAVTSGIVSGEALGGAPVPKLPDAAFQKAREPWELFREVLATLSKTMTGTAAWCEYVLLVDNADLLLDASMARERALIGELARREAVGGPVGLVLGGGRHLRQAVQEERGALASLRVLFLAALKESEAMALMRAGLPDIPNEAMDALMRESGKHPYVLQRLLSELELTPDVFDVRAAVEQGWPEVQQLFGWIWDEIDLDRGLTYRGAYAAPEHAYLQLLLDYGHAIDLKTAEVQLGIKPLREFAELLEYLGVGERVLRGDVVHLRAQFDLWNRWYSERILE